MSRNYSLQKNHPATTLHNIIFSPCTVFCMKLMLERGQNRIIKLVTTYNII